MGLGRTDVGTVVCFKDSGEGTEEQPANEQVFLQTGSMVEFPSMGLIHFSEPPPDLWLISQGKQ